MKYFFFVFLLTLISCSDLEEIGLDQARINEVTPMQVLPSIQSHMAFNQGSHAHRVAGIFVQYHDGGGICGHGPTFGMNERAMDAYWIGQYSGVISNCEEILLSDREVYPFYHALAIIYKANAYNELSLFFGDIPFSEAIASNNRQPKYDNQLEVLSGVKSLLDEAIEILKNSKQSYVGGDLVYNGDWQLWLKTAYALKARFLLQQEKVGDQNYQEILDLVALSYTSNNENASFQFEDNDNSNWSLSKFAIEREGSMWINNQFAYDLLNDADPRFDFYAVSNSYYDYYQEDNSKLTWVQRDAKVPLISFVELKFIEAECLLKSYQDPQFAFNQAVLASGELVGVENEAINDYVDNLPSMELLSFSNKMKLIMDQARRAYYGFNMAEAYHNYRRTNFPQLENFPKYISESNPTGEYPVRYYYPLSEVLHNTENLNSARAEQNGATLEVPLEIFK